MPKIVIVTGSRGWVDEEFVRSQIVSANPSLIVQGGCPNGPDKFAKRLAAERGIACVTFYADWKKHGKAAGPIRNRDMLYSFPYAKVLAFRLDGSPGTTNCIKEAKDMNMEVVVHDRYTHTDD